MYNSEYVNTKLFDAQYIWKMIAMCRYTKPNVLFSGVVKRKPVSKNVNNSASSTTVKANSIVLAMPCHANTMPYKSFLLFYKSLTVMVLIVMNVLILL